MPRPIEKTTGVIWQADAYINGKRKRKHFATEAEALEFERKANAGIDVTSGVTLSDFIDSEFNALWGGMKAEHTHRINCNLLIRYLGANTKIADIDEMMIDKMIEQMQIEKDSKNGTINRKLAVLSKLLKRARRHKLIEDIPVIEQLEEDGARELVLTDDQERRARLYFEHMGLVIEGALFDFLLYTGCRIGEALKVTRKSERPDGILFADRKNKKRKETNTIVPLVGPALTAWETALSYSKDDKPFGGPLTYTAFYRTWKMLQEHLEVPEEDIEWFVPHMLRHTCCTRLVAGGGSIPKVQKWMGHQSLKTTLRYSHLVPKDLDDLGSILERY